MPDLDLDSIRARVEATTPGPWEVYDPNEGSGHFPLWCVANDPYHNPPDDDEAWPALNVVVETGTREDAVFVAAARADVPALLSLVDVLDAAMHSVWLHGQWYWITRSMTTEEREAAWGAVQRYGARLHPGEPPMPDRLGA